MQGQGLGGGGGIWFSIHTLLEHMAHGVWRYIHMSRGASDSDRALEPGAGGRSSGSEPLFLPPPRLWVKHSRL